MFQVTVYTVPIELFRVELAPDSFQHGLMLRMFKVFNSRMARKNILGKSIYFMGPVLLKG